MFAEKGRTYPRLKHLRDASIEWSMAYSKHQTRLERTASDKQSSFLHKFGQDGRKKFYNIGPR